MFLLFGALKWGFRLLLLLVAAAVVYLLVTCVQVITSARAPRAADAVRHADAIVVIGAPSTGHTLATDGVARCSQAAVLYSAHRSSRVMATGGRSSASDTPEAQLLAVCMEHRGVPKRAIALVESGSVADQLHTVSDDLGGGSRHADPVIVVADPLETKWLEGVSGDEHLHVQVSPAPAPKVSFWSTVGQVWEQTAAVGYGRIFGYASVDWVKG